MGIHRSRQIKASRRLRPNAIRRESAPRHRSLVRSPLHIPRYSSSSAAWPKACRSARSLAIFDYSVQSPRLGPPPRFPRRGNPRDQAFHSESQYARRNSTDPASGAILFRGARDYASAVNYFSISNFTERPYGARIRPSSMTRCR